MAGLILLSLAALVPQALAACSSIEVRKEWRNFTVPEKTAWIDAVKCMANLPHNDSLHSTVGEFAATYANITTNSSYYDDWAYVHCDLNPVIHFTGLFLPFHRYFVWAYGQALKNSCGYKGVSPYWDWRLDAPDWNAATIWDSDETSGLGLATGVAADDYQLATGGFANNFTLAYPAPHSLRRNHTLEPWVGFADDAVFSEYGMSPYADGNATFTPAAISKGLTNFTGDYKGFQTWMEGFEGPHGAVHLTTGGDLGGDCPEDADAYCFANEGSPTWSANEPMFWMHHAMVDRVWWTWQNMHPNNTNAFFGGSVQNLTNWPLEYSNGAPPYLNTSSPMTGDGIFADALISDVLSTEGDFLCYTYDDAVPVTWAVETTDGGAGGAGIVDDSTVKTKTTTTSTSGATKMTGATGAIAMVMALMMML